MSRIQPNETQLLDLNVYLRKAYRVEEEYWKQRSHTNWLALGNKKHKLFPCYQKRKKSDKPFYEPQRQRRKPDV